MHTLIQDFRFAIRMLLKNPGFTAVAVLTLALGIGANTAIFSVVRSVLLRPLPFKDPDRLVMVWERSVKKGYEMNHAGVATFLDWKAQNNVFESMAAFGIDEGLSLIGDHEPELVTAAPVSANLFEVLGANPTLGRTFRVEEETPGHDQVVILSHGLWQRRFGSDPNLVGKTILLDGRSYLVIGIMPPGFVFPGMTGVLYGFFFSKPADVWIPLALPAELLRNPSRVSQPTTSRSSHLLEVVARLKPETSLAQAGAEMDAMMQRIAQANPGELMGDHAKVIPLREQSVGTVRSGLLVLLGAVAFVLLIACANVANLLLVRAASRQKEIAIRVALGASRLEIIRQLLTESVLLALLGGALGTLFALWSTDLFASRVGDTIALTTHGWGNIRIDRQVLGFTLLISLTTGVLFGLMPALQSATPNLNESLKEGERGSTEGFRRSRLRSSLVVTQIALAMMLLTGAALMLQSFLRLQAVNPGFDVNRVITMQLNLPESRYTNQQHRAVFFQQLTERFRSLPGVQFAAATAQLPLSSDVGNTTIEVVGRPPLPPGQWDVTDFISVTPEYLGAMQIPLHVGRFIGKHDTEDSPPVCVINQTTAHRYFGKEDPIGQKLKLGINSFTPEIVGVVRDVRQRSLDFDSLPASIQKLTSSQVYVPYAQTALWPKMTVVVRASSAPMGLANALRAEVRALDKDLPVSKVRTMETVRGESIAQPRFRALLIVLFGAVALALATIGIYGVMAYSVARRTHEIGLRMALGAQYSDVMKLVIRHGMCLTAIGLAIGLAGAFALTRLLSAMLYGVSATDPLTFVAVSLALAGVALCACYLPARRATKVDPMVALRYE
jgi:putative ABC transport system permease protein